MLSSVEVGLIKCYIWLFFSCRYSSLLWTCWCENWTPVPQLRWVCLGSKTRDGNLYKGSLHQHWIHGKETRRRERSAIPNPGGDLPESRRTSSRALRFVSGESLQGRLRSAWQVTFRHFVMLIRSDLMCVFNWSCRRQIHRRSSSS